MFTVVQNKTRIKTCQRPRGFQNKILYFLKKRDILCFTHFWTIHILWNQMMKPKGKGFFEVHPTWKYGQKLKTVEKSCAHVILDHSRVYSLILRWRTSQSPMFFPLEHSKCNIFKSASTWIDPCLWKRCDTCVWGAVALP